MEHSMHVLYEGSYNDKNKLWQYLQTKHWGPVLYLGKYCMSMISGQQITKETTQIAKTISLVWWVLSRGVRGWMMATYLWRPSSITNEIKDFLHNIPLPFYTDSNQSKGTAVYSCRLHEWENIADNPAKWKISNQEEDYLSIS